MRINYLEYGTDRILIDRAFKDTWFLSQEEAEQALKKRGGADDY